MVPLRWSYVPLTALLACARIIWAVPWLPPVHAVCHVPDHVLGKAATVFFIGLDFFLVIATLWVFAVERWNGPVWVSFRPPVTSPPATTMATPAFAMSATRDP